MVRVPGPLGSGSKTQEKADLGYHRLQDSDGYAIFWVSVGGSWVWHLL